MTDNLNNVYATLSKRLLIPERYHHLARIIKTPKGHYAFSISTPDICAIGFTEHDVVYCERHNEAFSVPFERGNNALKLDENTLENVLFYDNMMYDYDGKKGELVELIGYKTVLYGAPFDGKLTIKQEKNATTICSLHKIPLDVIENQLDKRMQDYARTFIGNKYHIYWLAERTNRTYKCICTDTYAHKCINAYREYGLPIHELLGKLKRSLPGESWGKIYE